MAEKILLVNLNLNGNILKNVAVETLAAAPENPVAGQFYVNSADGKFYYYNGTAWVAGAEYSAANKSAEGAIGVYAGSEGNQFQFKAVKGSGNLVVAESNGIITFSINEADMSVSDAVTAAIAAAKAEAIAAAATDATSKADAAQAAAEATAAADATSKANAAQAAAEATAAADATSKANAAEANAKAYTDAEIQKLDVTDAEVDGQVVVAVSETDGKIAVSRKALAAEKVTLSSTSTDATNVKAALEELYRASGAGSEVTMVATEGSGDAGKTYTFYQGGQDASHKIGEINVPKDLVLKSGSIVTKDGVPHLVLVLNDAASTEIDINLNDVFNDYQAGDSLELSGRTFNVVIDTNSEAFLTIDATSKRIKLSGVQSAINTAANAAQAAAEATAAADATAKANAAQAAAEATAAADATTKANAAEQNAKDYADTQDAAQKATIDNYTVQGKKISSNPTFTAKVAQSKITGAASGVTVATKFPGSIKAFQSGNEVAVAIAYDGTTATLTWNGNATLDIYYLAEDVTIA